MKSFTEYLYESIVDQYKEVRAAARPGDALLQYHRGSWPHTLETPHTGIDVSHDYDVNPGEFLPPVINRHPADNMDTSVGTQTMGHYDSQTQIPSVNLIGNKSWPEMVNTNSHEIAHASQHQRQMYNRNGMDFLRDPHDRIISIGNLTREKFKSFSSRMPRLATPDQMLVPKNSKRTARKRIKRNERIKNSGTLFGAPPTGKNYNYQYHNTDNEIGARVIGHAAEHMDMRSADKPRTTRHMRNLANHLVDTKADFSDTKKHVQSAIEDVRRFHLAKFRKTEDTRIAQPRTLKKAMHQYGSLIQHHEEELPADIHTPKGRDEFIRAHGSVKGDA